MVGDSQPSAMQAAPAWYADLSAQIDAHHQRDNERTYLGTAIDWVWHRDTASLSALEKLQDEAQKALRDHDSAKVERIRQEAKIDITKDRNEVNTADTVMQLGGLLVRTATLFLGGRTGFAANMLSNALDSARPGEALGLQVTDFALGAARGAMTKGILAGLQGLPLGNGALGISARGTMLGMSMRGIDTLFNRGNYYDQSGQFGIGNVGNRLYANVLNPAAIATDIVTFNLANGAITGINALTHNAISLSPFLGTVTTGGVFGLTSGMVDEASRQFNQDKTMHLWPILESGLTQGAIGAIAAIPGGLQAQAQYRRAIAQQAVEHEQAPPAEPSDLVVYDPMSQKVVVEGTPGSPEYHRVLSMLEHNLLPYERFDADATASAGEAPAPVVVRLADGTKLVNPTVQQLAERLHLHAHPNAAQYDLAIVGAGPAGLTAGIYGASEGLSTVVIDSQGFGGQAGSSSRIENYPGFPDGISGHDLTQREVRQAQRLGAELITLNGVDKIEQAGEDKLVHLSDGSSIHAKAVVVASGLQPRPLKIDGADRLADAGIYYGAGSEEVTNASGKHVIIVGGANSAGQAAVNFADHGATVDILVRGSSIDKDMSAYLIDQIKQRGQIRVHPNTEVMQVEGDARLHQVQVRNNSSGGSATMPADSMLVFIGSAPNTEWCDIAHDAQGYILSGPDLGDRWTLPGPPPFENETSMPGVFTAGDVQHGEVHRVATAVGSGAGTVSQVHRYLATRKSN